MGRGLIGRLTSYCDLGACCPALDVAGSLYALRLPDRYAWRGGGTEHEVVGGGGAVVAAEGDTVFVEGEVSGGDSCYATILERGVDVVSISSAYIGGLMRTGVCLVLSTDTEVLELKFAEGWDYDLVDGRMVVRDSGGNVVMGEGDRVIVEARPERANTGSFCMVGDDMIRVTRVIEVSG